MPSNLQMTTPTWAQDVLKALSTDSGLAIEEIAEVIICSHSRGFDLSALPHFSAPITMEHDFNPEDYMVNGRDNVSATISPTECVSFDEALHQFRDNGLSPDETLAVVKNN